MKNLCFRCKLCSQSLVFNYEILNRHLTVQHATSFSAYAERYLTQKPHSESSFDTEFAKTEEGAVLNEDQNDCIKIRLNLSSTDKDYVVPKTEPADEALEMDVTYSHQSSGIVLQRSIVKPEDDLNYEDPVSEGPGPYYQCPLNSCSYKTNQEVGTYYSKPAILVH